MDAADEHADAEGTVPEAIARTVARDPDAPCLTHGEATWSYGELWRHSGRIAAALRAAGAAPGDRVASMVAKSAHAVALYLGCLRAGAVYLPMNPDYTDGEAASILSDAQPAALVASDERTADLASALSVAAAVFTLEADGTGSLAEVGRSVDPGAGDVARAAADGAAMLYTSGTTGQPKGVLLSHRNLTSNARVLVAAWRFTDRDALLHALPIFHVHGLFVALHCALFAGAHLRLIDRFDAAEVVRRLPASTAFMGVPTFYGRLLGEPGLAKACRGMRLFTSGSAPLSPATHERFAERIGHVILERYGMTEAGMIASNPYDGERLAGSVGFPLAGVATRVVDERGELCDAGEVGVLEVSGPNVFGGYWRRPEADREAFRDGWLVTGDLVRCDPDGRIWIVGRSKDLIISGGMNVYPAEVENALDGLPDVGASAVIGVPHADFGEAAIAVVERRDSERDPDVEHLDRQLRRCLTGYKRPKRILVVDALPRNAMGKVEKQALRERYRELFDPPPPSDPTRPL